MLSDFTQEVLILAPTTLQLRGIKLDKLKDAFGRVMTHLRSQGINTASILVQETVTYKPFGDILLGTQMMIRGIAQSRHLELESMPSEWYENRKLLTMGEIKMFDTVQKEVAVPAEFAHLRIRRTVDNEVALNKSLKLYTETMKMADLVVNLSSEYDKFKPIISSAKRDGSKISVFIDIGIDGDIELRLNGRETKLSDIGL